MKYSKKILILILVSVSHFASSGQTAINLDSLMKVTRRQMDSTFISRYDSAITAENEINLGEIKLLKRVKDSKKFIVYRDAVPLIAENNNIRKNDKLDLKSSKDTIISDTTMLRLIGKKVAPDHRYVKNEANSIYTYALEDLDHIEIFIKDFAIQNISVVSNTGERYINKVPTSLTSFTSRYGDKLSSTGTDKFILLGEVIDFIPDTENRYYWEEFSVRLDPTKNHSHKLSASGSLNSLINFNVYSDLAALLEDEPNGIIQFEVDAYLPINNQNIREVALFPFRFINPSVKISRFNDELLTSQADSLPVMLEDSTTQYTNSISILELYQQAWLRVGANLNLLHYSPIQNHLEIMLNFTIYYNESNITQIDGNNVRGGSFTYGPGFQFVFVPNKHFGMNLNLDLVRLDFQGIQGTKPIDTSSNLINTSAQIYYQTENTNRFFVRWNYFNKLKDEQDFSQLQFGFRSTLKVPTSR